MPEPKGPDAAIVGILSKDGLLTQEQQRRVLRALDRGLPLPQALAELPLVEPLALLKAQARLQASEGVEPELAVESYRIEMLGVVEEREPAAPSACLPHARPLRSEAPPILQLPSGLATDWTSALPEYELTDHEGIPMMRELYGVLMELIDLDGRGLLVESGPLGDGFLSFYLASGKLGQRRPLEEWRGAKMAGRLGVMSRLESWRGESATGWFVARYGRVERIIAVKVVERTGGALASVAYLLGER